MSENISIECTNQSGLLDEPELGSQIENILKSKEEKARIYKYC